MSDHVQVSNARRVVFTAMALVAFWIVVWKAYSIACDDVYATLKFVRGSSGVVNFGHGELDAHGVYQVASMTLIPMLFLAVSVSNSLRGLWNPWLPAYAGPIVTTVLAARHLGLNMNDDMHAHMRDATKFAWVAWASWNHAHPDLTVEDAHVLQESVFEREFADLHESSWPWLLLPILLTTAFVIYGAWRSAARGREVGVEAAEEGE